MKILVPIKRVLDPNIPVRIDTDGKHIVADNQPHAMNPFDEVALAKAASMRADSTASELIALSIGCEKSVETLRTALAMGADRAIHVVTSKDDRLQSYDIALIIAHIVKEQQTDLVMMGKQSVDSDAGQTASLLAGFLDLPFLPDSFKIEISEGHVISSFDQDHGQTRVRAPLPAIISCELHLFEPRPISLPAMMKARQKPIASQSLQELPFALTPLVTVLELLEPAARPPCQIFDSANELAAQLRTDGLLK